MNKIEVIGIIAGAFSSLAPAIQMYKTFRTKKADDVSMLMFVFFLIGNILWCVYAYFINSTSIMFWNVLGVFGNLIAVYLKVKHTSSK